MKHKLHAIKAFENATVVKSCGTLSCCYTKASDIRGGKKNNK